jgi:putative GTP pyrophosphokinase
MATELEDEYSRILPAAEACLAETARQVAHLLEAADIRLGFPIEKRVKSLTSIRDKISRLQLRNLWDLTDLMGLRLIMVFKKDVLTASQLIEKTFEIVWENSERADLKEDQFGYSSVHFVVKLPRQWLYVPTFQNYGNLVMEIQIRTLAQHLWASASHILQYKKESNVPKDLQRAVNRLSAHLETVDLELNRVLEEHTRLKGAAYCADVSAELDNDSLERVLDALLPPQNKHRPAESYSRIRGHLYHFGIRTVGELISFWVSTALPFSMLNAKP